MFFSSLGLSKDLLQAIQYAGYEKPTAVQEKSIPLILKGQDIIAQAQTGTGKTAAFALPILQRLQDFSAEPRKTLKCLVLTPTRELSLQVSSEFKDYGRQLTKPLKIITLVGGMNIDLQIRGLHHGADIAVATPGRLLDLVKRNEIVLNTIKILVIDEADKMFDLGFSDELVAILNVLPTKRQNLLFSATMDEKVSVLAHQFMKTPAQLRVETDTPTAERIEQRVIEVNRTNRGPLLRHLIQSEKWDHTLIFVATVRGADILATKLRAAGIEADSFHGGMTQAQRVQALSDFKSRKIRVLVATDIAARGLDINKLSYVINYDLPRSTDDYIHRVGRTARAGEKGVAISFIGHEDQKHFDLIEKRTRIRVPRESIKGFELIGEPLSPGKGPAPIKGKRMSKKDKARALALKQG